MYRNRVLALMWFVLVWFVLGMVNPAVAATVPADTVVKAGIGLASVHIGESYDDVTHLLGPPNENLYGFVFVYQLPNKTELNFRITDNKVVAVNIKGNARSVYTTERGVRFGMTRKQVEGIYGPPEAQAVNTFFYYSQGISFLFNDANEVYEFNVFRPNSH